MKNKLSGMIFLIVIAAAVIGGIYYYLQRNIVVTPTYYADWATLTDKDNTFEVRYPKNYKYTPPDALGMYTIAIPANLYPKTNLNEAYMVFFKANNSSEEQCKTFDIDGAKQKSKESENINGINFDKIQSSGAAAGNIYESKSYSAFHGSICYQVNMTVHTSNIQNYEPGIVQEINKDDIWNQLHDVLSTFKFTK